jgi:hypothetical protein
MKKQLKTVKWNGQISLEPKSSKVFIQRYTNIRVLSCPVLSCRTMRKNDRSYKTLRARKRRGIIAQCEEMAAEDTSKFDFHRPLTRKRGGTTENAFRR